MALNAMHMPLSPGQSTLRDCNPCLRVCEFGPVAVQPTTWSRIKTLGVD